MVLILVFGKSLESGCEDSLSKLIVYAKTGGGDRTGVRIQPGELTKDSTYWHKLVQDSEENRQGIYCKILQAHVRVCRLAACRHYTSCHVTA
jgi:hypothetical protein